MGLNRNRYTFFLGGKDLEMIEIRALLMEYGVSYIDHGLGWSEACWSSYKEYFDKDHVLVGIELKGKEEMPENAIDIDHHNERSNEPASIEQVAELLGVKLNRWQQLVAANDKGYIPAMKAICATEEEIEKIRLADRKAQGVSEEDERLAEGSIECHKSERNGVTIVRSLTARFSPITDRMYGKAEKLLVYTGESLNYYGKGKKKLVEEFQNLIEEGTAYHGGGDDGFFGIVHGKMNKDRLKETREKIIEIVGDKEKIPEMYSHHVFLFPFKWQHWDKGDSDPMKDRFDLEEFEKEIERTQWKRKPFDLSTFENYNEYNYFYGHVREILYDQGKDLETTTPSKNKRLLKHFKYEAKGLHYCIKVHGHPCTYYLEINSILLNVYSTGTAVLSFHLRNHRYKELDDILRINKFGRRLYPPFFGLGHSSVATGKPDEIKAENALLGTKEQELPCAIWIGEADSTVTEMTGKPLFEDFRKYRDKDNYKHGPFLLPNFIGGLFPADFILTHKKLGFTDPEYKNKNKNFKIYLRHVLDDRMFVICWYGNEQLTKQLCAFPEGSAAMKQDQRGFVYELESVKKQYAYANDDRWYKYVFLDIGQATCTDRHMKERLLTDHSYTRWIEPYGTLYGITRYSLVALTGSDLRYVSFLVRHMQTMYYKMAELSLMQRATILSYSDEVTHVSHLMHDDGERNTLEQIRSLYKHYIMFVNKIYFKEVTAQEQGIEMYDMMQKHMRIPADVKDLDQEIEELHRYASMVEEELQTKEDKMQTQQMTQLTLIGALFLIPTFIVGYFGMNFFDFACEGLRELYLLTTLLLTIPIIKPAYDLLNSPEKLKDNDISLLKKMKFKRGIGLLVAIILLPFLFWIVDWLFGNAIAEFYQYLKILL